MASRCAPRGRIPLALLVVLGGCGEWEPYVEVSTRHERLGDTRYEGETATVGMRYRRVSAAALMPSREPDPVHVHVPGTPPGAEPGEEKAYDKEITAAGTLPWYAWLGLTAVILAASVLLWVWRRGKRLPGSAA